MNRIVLELFRLAALLGCGLSLTGLVLNVWFRLEFVIKQGPILAGPDTRARVLHILDACKEPGIPFLLSALLYATCAIAIRHSRRKPAQNDSAAPTEASEYSAYSGKVVPVSLSLRKGPSLRVKEPKRL